jgi:hypothetical protein
MLCARNVCVGAVIEFTSLYRLCSYTGWYYVDQIWNTCTRRQQRSGTQQNKMRRLSHNVRAVNFWPHMGESLKMFRNVQTAQQLLYSRLPVQCMAFYNGSYQYPFPSSCCVNCCYVLHAELIGPFGTVSALNINEFILNHSAFIGSTIQSYICITLMQQRLKC